MARLAFLGDYIVNSGDTCAKRTFMRTSTCLSSIVLLGLTAELSCQLVEGHEVTIAADGKAKFAIGIAVDASEQMNLLATTFSTYLAKISGAEFHVERGIDGRGIVLRVDQPKDLAVFGRERYSIRSHANGVTLAGTTESALEHAVWDFLYRLGYRQFFPGETWEVVPQWKTIRVDLNVAESPDYHFRRIWYGFGTWDYNREPWLDWCRKNRMGGSMEVRSGHAYGGIIRAKQAVFDEHPEFYALIDGKRNVHPQAKLCIGNAKLRQTVVEFAKEYSERQSDEDCISMDPSDGGGWCECKLCQSIGSPSDRALTLANQVADAVKPRYVGMYAYNYHSPPPTIRVQPNVCINAATAFIKGGRTIDEIISGWSAKGAKIGIREYYAVSTWDRDLPGAARGSNLEYLATTLPDFHSKGARFLNSESSDNWGCNGLGYYFSSRVMWNLDEAARRDEIVEDFLDKSFGPAKEPMREFYALIDGSNKASKLVYGDLLARMYRLLDKAGGFVTGDSTQQERIDDLILYTRYADLYDRYRNASGAGRQQRFEQMIRHVYRMRRTMMVHAKGLYRDVVARDRTVNIPENATWGIPETQNPWKSSEPFSSDEIAGYLREGIANYKPIELDFEPKEFSDNLVPAAPLKLRAVPAGQASRARGLRSWYTRLDDAGEIVLNITGGLIAHYRDRGNVKVSVWQLGGASESDQRTTLVAKDNSVPPDGKQRTIRIAVKQAGLYRIDITDGNDLTQVTWPAGQPMTMKMSLDDHPRSLNGRWYLWFYVPRGTKKIGMYVQTTGGSVLRPDGETAMSLDKRPGQYISVDVPTGMDGQLWKLRHIAGRICLMNVPPFLAQSPDELLLPADVVRLIK